MKKRVVIIVVLLGLMMLGSTYVVDLGDGDSGTEEVGRGSGAVGEEEGEVKAREETAEGAEAGRRSTAGAETEGESTEAAEAGGEVDDLEARLAASPYSVLVRVLDSAGEPLQVEVECFFIRIQEYSVGVGTTNDEGVYERKLLEPGSYSAVASLEGTLNPQGFEISEQSPAAEVEIRYPGTASISGEVIAVHGALIDDVRGEQRALGEEALRVEAILQEEHEDEEDSLPILSSDVDGEGKYNIAGLAAGKYMVRIRTKFHVDELELDDGEHVTHDIHLGRGRISGRVTDGTTGEAAANTQVVLRMVSYEKGDPELMARAQLDLISDRLAPDEDGDYAFSNLPFGEYKIFSNGGGYGISKKDVTISAKDEDIVVDFVMQPGAVINLAIQGRSGNDLPVPRASTQGVTWGFTGFVGGLNTGTHDVVGNAEGHEIQIRKGVVFGSEEPVDVTFKLEPAVSTRLYFVDPSGAPLSDVRVSIPHDGHDIQELTKRLVRGSDLPFVKTAAEGWVQVLGLKAGSYRVVAKAREHRFEGPVTLESGKAEQRIEMIPTEEQLSWRVKISGVTPGGEAARAGLEVGDFILKYNAVEIDSEERLVAAIATAKEQGLSSVEVVVDSGGTVRSIGIPSGVLGASVQEVEM